MGDLVFYVNIIGECECKAGFKMRKDGEDSYDYLLAELFSEDATIEDQTNKECVRDVFLFAVRGGGGLFASIGEKCDPDETKTESGDCIKVVKGGPDMALGQSSSLLELWQSFVAILCVRSTNT